MRKTAPQLTAAVLATVAFGFAVTPAASSAPDAAPAKAVLCLAGGEPDIARSAVDRARTVNDAIVAMLKDGSGDDDIATVLRRDYGVHSPPAAGHQQVEPLSTGSDIVLRAPRIIYDTCAARWYVYAHYYWNGMGPLTSERQSVLCDDPCPIGGLDGFGLTFSRPVSSVGSYFMQTWGRTPMYPLSTGRAWVEDANTHGVTFVGQDEYCAYVVWGQPGQSCYDNKDYSFYYGELFYMISNIGCGSIQAFSKYGHDWKNTTINGFSVGPWSLGISWSSSSNKWAKTSSPSTPVVPC